MFHRDERRTYFKSADSVTRPKFGCGLDVLYLNMYR